MTGGRLLCVGLGLGLALGPSLAAFAGEGDHPRARYSYIASDIRNPDWAEMPNGQQMARLYPPTTDMPEGAAAVRCKVLANGVLQACAVLDERPAGLGFGRAALQVSRYFRLKTIQRDGRSIAGRTVVVPIQWRFG